MPANLTLYTCRDCGITIPDGRGWFVWPGFPADGSAPRGVVWIEDEPEDELALTRPLWATRPVLWASPSGNSVD
jgi:hypothetical protein